MAAGAQPWAPSRAWEETSQTVPRVLPPSLIPFVRWADWATARLEDPSFRTAAPGPALCCGRRAGVCWAPGRSAGGRPVPQRTPGCRAAGSGHSLPKEAHVRLCTGTWRRKGFSATTAPFPVDGVCLRRTCHSLPRSFMPWLLVQWLLDGSPRGTLRGRGVHGPFPRHCPKVTPCPSW